MNHHVNSHILDWSEKEMELSLISGQSQNNIDIHWKPREWKKEEENLNYLLYQKSTQWASCVRFMIFNLQPGHFFLLLRTALQNTDLLIKIIWFAATAQQIYAWIEMSETVWKPEPSLNIRHLWQEWYFDCLTFNAWKCLCRKFAAQQPQMVLVETHGPTITITTRIHLNTVALRNKCASLHTEYIDRIGDSTCHSYCHVQFFGSSAFSFCLNFFFRSVSQSSLCSPFLCSSSSVSTFVFAVCAHISGMPSRNEFYYSCYFDNFLE